MIPLVYVFLVVKRSRRTSELSEVYIAGFKFILIYEDKEFLLYFLRLPFEKYSVLKSLFDKYTKTNLPDCFLVFLFLKDDSSKGRKSREEVVKTISLFVKNKLYTLGKRDFDYEEVEKSVKAYMELCRKVERALLKGSLLLAKQPIVDENKRVCGFELLSRLYDEESQTLIYPKDYLFVFKRAKDLIYVFEDQVFEKGVKLLTKSKNSDLLYHVNFSPFYLFDNFRYIEKELSRRDLKEKLVIEVTENLFDIVLEEDDLVELSHILSSEGIKVIFDDFGEGRSNIYLTLRSSFYGLKLSSFLVREYTKMFDLQLPDYSEKKRAIINSLVKLVRDLSQRGMIKIYVEGVEGEEDFLRCKQAINSSYFQGFYFGKPDLSPRT